VLKSTPATKRQGKGGEAEIRFCLATAGRKPEQVTDISISMRWIGKRRNIEERAAASPSLSRRGKAALTGPF